MSETTVRKALGATVRLAPFLAEAQRSGHHPRSLYVERFWLPILGPATTFLIRHLALVLEAGEELVTLSDVAAALGLAEGARREGAFFRSLERGVAFEMLRVPSPNTLLVRALIPDVSPRRRLHLSAALRGLESELGARAVRLPTRPPARPDDAPRNSRPATHPDPGAPGRMRSA